jgi:peptidoglycan hydrolase CwlO-like protein
VEEYARKQHEKNKKIKGLKEKIDMLEQSLKKIVNDFEKEKELLKFQSEQIVRE